MDVMLRREGRARRGSCVKGRKGKEGMGWEISEGWEELCEGKGWKGRDGMGWEISEGWEEKLCEGKGWKRRERKGDK